MNSFARTEVLIRRGDPLPDFEEHGVSLSHHFVGNEYAKVFEVPAGKVIGQHVHKFGHPAILMIGIARVHVNGVMTEYVAPEKIYIDANAQHCVEAVTDILWACLWPNEIGATTPEEIDDEVIA